MIVVLTGSHSTGKTTLLEFFRNDKNFDTIGSVTRSVLRKEERKIEEGISDESQMKVLMGIEHSMGDILALEKKEPYKIHLLDRCVFDFLAYTKAFRDRGFCSDNFVQIAESRLKSFITHYDVVFYLPIEFNCVDDGVRSMDEELRKDVDRYIQEEILWYRTRAIKLTGSVLQRVERIRNTVDLVGKDDIVYARKPWNRISEYYVKSEDPFCTDIIRLWNDRNMDGYMFEASYKSSVVGFVLLEYAEDLTCTIRGLWINSAFRNRGIAHRLLKEVTRFEEGDIWVNITKGAEKIYEEFGFRRIGERKEFSDQVLYYKGSLSDSEIPKEIWDKVIK